MKTALLVGAVTPISLAPRRALLQFSRDAQHQSLGHCSRSLHHCCSVKQDENSLACRCSHFYKFGTSHSSAAIQQRCAAPKPGTLFTLIAPGLLSKARRQQPCLLVLPHLRVSALDTALLQFGRDAQHQSLGPCSRSMHQCCSVKQDENSLACRCIHANKFGASHSSAAIQQRCAAPKPGTLFTLIAPGLLSKARRQQPCLLVLPHLRVSALDTALLQFSRDAQHQSLGPCSRSLHQCCSVKQDENSLACRCSHTYKFGTLHSSAATQQRCAAPKPGTLFTLTAPVLLCEAR